MLYLFSTETGTVAQTASLSMGLIGFGVKLTTDLHLVPRLMTD
jgi:hypothetical protein